MAEPESPLQEAVARVGDRWTLLVIDALMRGPLKFGELSEAVGGIAPNDGFMGYQWTVSIPAGGQATFNVVLSYGSRSAYACYPDCNCDGALTVADFGCFQTSFVAASGYGDCNGDGVRTVADFGCFQTRFVQGCN